MHRQIYMSIIKGLLSSCPTACIMSSSYAGNCTYSNIIIIVQASGSICKLKSKMKQVQFISTAVLVLWTLISAFDVSSSENDTDHLF